jgi:hypothetical protein
MTRESALAELRALFERNGYVRSGRRAGTKDTHRGYEIRFGAFDAAERERIGGLLRTCGYRPGRPFEKGGMFRVPVYGLEQVRELSRALGIRRKEERRALPATPRR